MGVKIKVMLIFFITATFTVSVSARNTCDVDQSLLCTSWCEMTFNETIEITLGHLPLTPMENCSIVKNLTRYDSVCDSYKAAKQCVDSCPDGWKKSIVGEFVWYKVYCSDQFVKDYKQYETCMQNVCHEFTKCDKCDKETDFRNLVDASIYPFPNITKNAVSAGCNFVTCIYEKCLPKDETCVKGAYKTQVRAMRTLALEAVDRIFKSQSMPRSHYPKECKILEEKENSAVPNRISWILISVMIIFGMAEKF